MSGKDEELKTVTGSGLGGPNSGTGDSGSGSGGSGSGGLGSGSSGSGISGSGGSGSGSHSSGEGTNQGTSQGFSLLDTDEDDFFGTQPQNSSAPSRNGSRHEQRYLALSQSQSSRPIGQPLNTQAKTYILATKGENDVEVEYQVNINTANNECVGNVAIQGQDNQQFDIQAIELYLRHVDPTKAQEFTGDEKTLKLMKFVREELAGKGVVFSHSNGATYKNNAGATVNVALTEPEKNEFRALFNTAVENIKNAPAPTQGKEYRAPHATINTCLQAIVPSHARRQNPSPQPTSAPPPTHQGMNSVVSRAVTAARPPSDSSTNSTSQQQFTSPRTPGRGNQSL